jgi:hypothetical protein
MKVEKEKIVCTCPRGTTTLTLSAKEVHDLKVIAAAVTACPEVLARADGITPRTDSGCRTYDVYRLLSSLRRL